MRTTQIWREIRKIKESTSTFKIVNPKPEANRLADHLTTRADQTTLPRNIIAALKQQIPLRQSNLAAAKPRHKQAVLIRHKKTAPGEDGFIYTFYAKAPRSFKKRILNLFNQS